MTEAKQQIIAESEHTLHTYIIEAVVSGHFRRQLGEEFSFDALQRQLAKEGYGRRRRTYVGSKDCRRREEASVCPALSEDETEGEDLSSESGKFGWHRCLHGPTWEPQYFRAFLIDRGQIAFRPRAPFLVP